MDVIEITRQLGKAIQADERYIDYVNAKTRNDEDEELQQLIGEFNLIRQNVALESGKPDEERNKERLAELNVKMHSAYNAVMANENMAIFTVAKQRMDKLMGQINTILTYSMEGMDPDTCPSEVSTGCSGSCSGCSGCGG